MQIYYSQNYISKVHKRAIKWLRQLVLSHSHGVSNRDGISTVRITVHFKRDIANVKKKSVLRSGEPTASQSDRPLTDSITN